MGIDVINVSRGKACLPHGDAHCHAGAASIRGGGCDMVRVIGHTIAHDLGQNLRIPFPGMLVFFKDQYACALTQDKTVPVFIKGARGQIRVFCRRQCF